MSEDIKEIFRNFAAVFAVLFAVASVVAFIAGIIEATESGRCSYQRLISLHPARVIGCELFKTRWPEQIK